MGTVNFKSYWDHSERERSNLTEEDVASMLNAELMIEGVMKPIAPPKKRDVKDIQIETQSFACVRWNHGIAGAAFKSAEDAELFLSMAPLFIDHAWEVDRHFVKPIGDAKITVELLPDERSITSSRAELARIKAENEALAKEVKEYEAQLAKVDSVTRGVWDNWHEQRGKLARAQRTRTTFLDYVKMTNGDRGMAIGFLLKLFNVDAIRDAALWTEDADFANALEAWVDTGESPPPSPAAKLAAPEADDIAF